MSTQYRGFCDLHRHLDGSLRWHTVESLARATNQVIPQHLSFTPGMGLTEALERFAFTVSLLQTPEHLTRATQELCADADAEGLEYLEIRFAPLLHGPVATAIDAVLDGLSKRAGLILCGLYGDDPTRLDALFDLALTRPGVVGVDLAGAPHRTHRWQLMDYAEVFTKAHHMGLGVTIHAGEGRPAAEIGVAITHLNAQRIGHGVTLMNDPRVLELVLERRVTIEACPTSNVHTGVIASVAEHPLVTWLDAGVSVAVCTDNTLLSETDLPTELDRVRKACALSSGQMKRLKDTSRAGAFSRRR